MQTVDSRGPDELFLSGGSGPGEPQASPLRLAHQLLRGRYVWAAVLGGALAIPLSLVGYRSKTPVYSSEGVVAIAPTQRQILYQTAENEAIPFFDQYVERQAALLGSQRVFQSALDDPRLRAAGWSAATEGLKAMSDAVSVSIPRRSGMIYLRVSHPSAERARVACQAILDSYEELHRYAAESEFRATEQALLQLQRNRQSDWQASRASIRAIAERHGTENLQPMIDGLNRELLSLDFEMARIESALTSRGEPLQREPPPVAPDPGAVPAMAPAGLSLEMLAAHDAELAALLQRRDQLVAEITAYTAQFSARHREVTSRQGQLVTIENLVLVREAAVRSNWTTPVVTALSPSSELRVRLAECASQRAKLFERLRSMAADQSQMLAEQARAEKAEADRQEAAQRLAELKVESDDTRIGRASIQQPATMPTSPSSDKRMMFAGMGGVGGLLAGIGIVAAVGLARGGFRYIDEFDGDHGSVLLGVVPDLGGRHEPTAEAALCIHHARALLDRRVAMRRDRGRIIAVTSPTAGDGKTTVCCSLATSFAMAGFRTVVIDADLVGRGMTTRLGMDRVSGLGDALAGGPLEESIAEGGTANLRVIPAGREESMTADRMASSAVRPLLERLARTHDVVLVDTGPVLGSLEATLLVGLSDAVLAVVSRGQSTRMFASMRRKLQSLGAELSGVIFNRAYPRDFASSTHTSVVSAQSQRARTVQVPDFVTMGNRGMGSRLVAATGTDGPKARSA